MGLVIRTEERSLFSVTTDYKLAHCISSDFALGAGIALEFDKRFDMRAKLNNSYPGYMYDYINNNINGDCLQIGSVYNLVTKQMYYNKPSYTSFKNSINSLKHQMERNKDTKLAIPKLGCGLDKLSWNKVFDIIVSEFEDYKYDLEIIVCVI